MIVVLFYPVESIINRVDQTILSLAGGVWMYDNAGHSEIIHFHSHPNNPVQLAHARLLKIRYMDRRTTV